MYHFNLLPQPQQKRITRWIILRQLANSVVFVNVLLLIMVATIFLANMSLQDIIAASSTSPSITDPHSGQNAVPEVKQINSTIAQLATVHNEHVYYLNLLTQLTEEIPADIAVTSIDINFEESHIAIAGTGADRDALKNLETVFENDERFTIDAFPFEVFTQATDLPFSIELSFALDDFVYDDSEQL